MSDNGKVNKERDKCKHRSHEKITHYKQVEVYASLLEAKRRQSLTKPDKIRFLNEPKQTERAKQKHSVNMMHTNIPVCVTFDMSSFATPQSTVLLYFV